MAGVVAAACAEVGCPGLALDGARYCSGHAELERQRVPFKKNHDRNPFYNSAQWRKLRLAFLARNPECAQCKRAAATVVHHIIPARQRPDLRADESNLQALCHSCHNAESQREAMQARQVRAYGAGR